MKKTNIFLIILIFLSLGTLLTITIVLQKKQDNIPTIEDPIDKPKDDQIIEDIKSSEEQLSECMKKSDPIFDLMMNLEAQNLTNEFEKYNMSVLYNNLLDDYQVKYNEKENYYSASTVKPAVALYYYTMASKGLIDLEEKVTFSQKYWDTTMTKRLELNSVVSLRTLLKYSMTYSDNGAHLLLIERIGYKNINKFVVETIGPQNTFFPNSPYGRINVVDGTFLTRAVYKFIEENGDLGQELKGYMVNSILRTLKIDDIKIAQKYGWWEKVFHVIGIVYDEQPYTIVVLTKHGENDEYFQVIKDINLKVANFHKNYMYKKTEFCSSKIVFK